MIRLFASRIIGVFWFHKKSFPKRLVVFLSLCQIAPRTVAYFITEFWILAQKQIRTELNYVLQPTSYSPGLLKVLCAIIQPGLTKMNRMRQKW